MLSDSAEAPLFNPDPATYLPHRYPFLLLDRIIDLEKGVHASARLSPANGRGFPQVLLIESVAQLAGILTITEEGEGGFLAAIDHAEFAGPVQAGDLLTITARVIKSFGRLFMVEGRVSSERNTLLTVQLTLGVGRL